MTPTLRCVLPSGAARLSFRNHPAFAPPVPNLQGNRLGLPGTLNDGTIQYAPIYTDFMADGEARAQAEIDLRAYLSYILPPDHNGPAQVSFEHFEPKQGASAAERAAAITWRDKVMGVIQAHAPGAVLYGYNSRFPDHNQVCRDLYPIQSNIKDQMRTYAEFVASPRGTLATVPIMADWMKGWPGVPMPEDFYSIQCQASLIMAKVWGHGEIWLWQQGESEDEVKLSYAGQERAAARLL